MYGEQLFELRGTVERIVFFNDQNGYTVLTLLSNSTEVTVVGNMEKLSIGEELQIVGKWINHHNFGTQFQVERYKRFMPSTCDSIVKYLSSGIIKGVGQITAQKLVDVFGENTLNVIQSEPERLFSVIGVPKSTIKKIIKEFNEILLLKDILQTLQEYGITPEEAVRIYKQLGSGAVEQIKCNPYIICAPKINIGFEKADFIASLLNRPPDDSDRIKSAIVYVLRHNINNGHTCVPESKLISAVSSFIDIDQSAVNNYMQELLENHILDCDFINDVRFVFTPDMFKAERYCSSRILMMLDYPPPKIMGCDKEIKDIELSQGIEYAPLQKKAISDALSKGILVMTGGPGTGKTTVLKAIIKILKDKGERVLLAAPTGRASRRLSEVTGCESKTIHRMLEVGWDKDNNPIFNRNEKNLLDCDALIVDELSMVDILLFEGLLRSLPLGCRLIMVGDTDQLPSVGAGNVLGDLVASGVTPVVQLKDIFRQSQKSLIVMNAHNIVKGQMPVLNNRASDFFFMNMYNADQIKNTVVDLFKRRLPNRYGYSPLDDIQIICPSRKGVLGTLSLNLAIQEEINPKSPNKKEIVINSLTLRENDKVMQNKNNYNIYWEKADGTSGEGVFNGDVGIILQIDKALSYIAVKYDDRVAVYDFESANDLELAYAITVHKSQGSEFEAVIIPILGKNSKLYYRNILYTAVTRTRSMLVMLGAEATVKQMVDNVIKTKRYSAFSDFLKNKKHLNIEHSL